MNADPVAHRNVERIIVRRNDERIIVRRAYRDFCVEMAKSIPACRARNSFLRMAAFWELEVKLLERTSVCLTESRELLAKTSALLVEADKSVG